jgi:hypothetical protein
VQFAHGALGISIVVEQSGYGWHESSSRDRCRVQRGRA